MNSDFSSFLHHFVVVHPSKQTKTNIICHWNTQWRKKQKKEHKKKKLLFLTPAGKRMECKNLKAVLHFQIWKAKDKKKWERNYSSIPEMERVQRSLNEIQELRLRKKTKGGWKKIRGKKKNIEEWTQTKFECRCKLMRKKQTRRIFFFFLDYK